MQNLSLAGFFSVGARIRSCLVKIWKCFLISAKYLKAASWDKSGSWSKSVKLTNYSILYNMPIHLVHRKQLKVMVYTHHKWHAMRNLSQLVVEDEKKKKQVLSPSWLQVAPGSFEFQYNQEPPTDQSNHAITEVITKVKLQCPKIGAHIHWFCWMFWKYHTIDTLPCTTHILIDKVKMSLHWYNSGSANKAKYSKR